MKKAIVYIGLIFSILMLLPVSSYSQRKLGQTVVTANTGVSPMGMIASIGANSNASGDVFRSGPVYIAHTDIGISKLISIGPSATYQSFRYYYDFDTPQGLIRCRDVSTRANYGGRLLFHFGNKEKEQIDMYAGIRGGYTQWTLETNNPGFDTTYTVSDFEKNQPNGLRVPLRLRNDFHFTAQVLYGFRYYFSKFAGFNFEIGIGGPAFFSVGLQTKLF